MTFSSFSLADCDLIRLELQRHDIIVASLWYEQMQPLRDSNLSL